MSSSLSLGKHQVGSLPTHRATERGSLLGICPTIHTLGEVGVGPLILPLPQSSEARGWGLLQPTPTS